MIGKTVRDFLPKRICSPISRRSCASTTQFGRRDNLYKSRIKILVQALGVEKMRDAVEAEFAAMGEEPARAAGGNHRGDRPAFRAARL